MESNTSKPKQAQLYWTFGSLQLVVPDDLPHISAINKAAKLVYRQEDLHGISDFHLKLTSEELKQLASLLCIAAWIRDIQLEGPVEFDMSCLFGGFDREAGNRQVIAIHTLGQKLQDYFNLHKIDPTVRWSYK